MSGVLRDGRDEQNNGQSSSPGREHSPHKDRLMNKPGMSEAKHGF